MLSGVERKTGWLPSEQAGLERPCRMQSLLGRSRWSADGLRDLVQGYVIEALGDTGGVLVVDETGFVKKGRHSVGVARQYSGTAGPIENCQIGVFLGYACRYGQALIDRRLYLPKEWAEDAARRAKDDLGLDHCEARSWRGWNRHMTLCMAAAGFLAKLVADLRRAAWRKPNKTSPVTATGD